MVRLRLLVAIAGLQFVKRCILYNAILLLCFLSKKTSAQQGNNWYFGEYAGLTFNTSPPSALLNSAMSTMEGCSAISDSNGVLLFYTDGSFVYNRNHQVMLNGSGLMGHPSASNSAIIAGQPGSDSLYYIFTADAAENNFANGYRYSVVDMSLDGGLGDVSTKNVLLYAPCTEKITAVKHANGTDAWIITKDYTGNTYKSFLLGCNGLDTNPVVSNAGVMNTANASRIGSIKASPNGSRIATVQYFGGTEIFSFDKATGRLAYPLLIPYTQGNLFGIEFSPNSRLLYVASECCIGSGMIFQYKVDVYDSTVISNSKYIVDASKFMKGDMQLGPDGKIYIPNEQDSSLNVINNPDQYGVSCGYQYKAVNLGFGRIAKRCLPAFFKDNINSSTTDFSYFVSPGCGEVTFAGTTSLPGTVSWLWDFGDGDTATGQVVTHSFTASGSFIVTLTVSNPGICGAKAKRKKTLFRYSIPPVARFAHTFQCGSKTVQFIDSSSITSGSIASWYWDFGDGQTSTSINPQHTYTLAGQYRVRLKVISFGLCPKEDTVSEMITIIPATPAYFSLGADTAICSTALQLNAGGGFKTYLWQNGTADSLFLVTQPGKYYVLVTDYCNHFFSDTILVTLNQPAPINLGNDTSFCINQPLILNAGSGFVKYLWNNGDTLQFQNVTGAGMYAVAATNNDGCISKDSIQILNAFPAPVILLDKKNILCFNQNNTINAGTGYSSYLWQNGSTDSIITAVNPGWYKVTVGNINNCFSSDSVKVIKIAVAPTDFLNRDSVICSDETILISSKQLFSGYLWSNGSTNAGISISPPGTVWLTVTDNNNCKGTDTIKISGRDCATHFYIPSAFTPNNDGLNDMFKPVISGRIEEYEFSIYNIYGQRIFMSNVIGKGWDGTFRDLLQNQGVYIWYCRYRAKKEKSRLVKGPVQLIR